ncbi:MAG TPA: TonB-dependent receptor [Gammaproteobacteria bacterium]
MKSMPDARRLRLLLIAGLLMPPVALAQEADEEDDYTELERVEVTGSRIRQTDIEGLNPIQTLTREDLDQSGLQSVGDFLQRLAISGSTINTKFNSSGNFGFPPDGSGVGAGATYLDLRHLGPKRVLVLVDGIRWVNGSSGSGVSNATDLNTIPMAMVERIEIVKDGASAIYGSDAIAGVVNIITRKDFNGLEANVTFGDYSEGDGETMSADISYGLLREGGSAFFTVSHMDQEEISAADIAQARFPVPGTGLTRGSSGTPQGRFIFLNPDDAGGLCPESDGVNVCDITTPGGSSFTGGIPDFPGDFIPFSNDERFNFSPYNMLLTPSRRSSIFGQVNFDVLDNTQAYFRGLYNNRQSSNRAAPEPIFIGADAGTGGLADSVSIDATNPYNPLGFTLESGSNFFLLGRRPVEGGPRIFEQNVDTFYFGAGLRGSFEMGERLFYWDINAATSRNRADQTTYGSYNIRRIATALGPIDECNADPRCVPLNLFGGAGSITEDMLDYIQPILHDLSENNLRLYSANITGDLFEMPAGPFAVAAGFETRELSGFYRPDALVVAGESNGVPSLPTSGSYDVDAFYAEANIPLLADMTAVQQLDLSLAVRWFDYSTFGSDTTAKYGLEYRPSDELLFRASAAEGFRAPSIGELFGSASRFDATLSDPCSNYPGTAFEDECAALGIPASYEQINPQISVTTGGNPELLPEESDSLMFGAVYSPAWAAGLSWADRLDFELTWYSHELTDAIQAIDAQFQLVRCVQTNDPLFCSGINRTPGGEINGFANRLTNIGGVETTGFDFNVRYASPDFGWGRITVNWNNAFVTSYDEIQPSGESLALEGRERNDRAIPEFQSNILTDWTFGDWSAAWTLRYIDAITEPCTDFLDGTEDSLTALDLCSNPNIDNQNLSTNELDATLYNDVLVTYRLGGNENFTVGLGVNNLLDQDPPICLSCSLNGYDASTYDIPGRFYYVRASWRM